MGALMLYTHQVAGFHKVKKGQPVGMDIQLGPEEVKFEGSFKYYAVEAVVMDGGKKTLTIPDVTPWQMFRLWSCKAYTYQLGSSICHA